jgi:hypothetical protein
LLVPIVLDMARCPHCPIDPGLSCEGLRVRRLCELVDLTHAAYNPDYLSLLRSLTLGATEASSAGISRAYPAADDDSFFGQLPGSDQGEPAPGESLASLITTESLALLRRMRACPHRIVRTDCGCAGLARCVLGRGHDGLVNHFDCFDCLRASGCGTATGPAPQEP